MTRIKKSKTASRMHEIYGKIEEFLSSKPQIAPILLAAIVFVIFFGVSAKYTTGPAYLSDEVGYLTKAAAFSGSEIDAASSWHAGYSILISPSFFLLDSPEAEWIGVIFINALMWSASAALLYLFITKAFPARSNIARFLAVLAALSYPSFVSMSGYAFSTSGSVFILLLAIFTFLKAESSKGYATFYTIIFGILSGYLYWVHPTGVAFSLSAILILISAAIIRPNNRSRYLLSAAAVVVMLVIYSYAVSPWFSHIMTPDGYKAVAHYSDSATRLTAKLFTVDFWTELPVRMLGATSYLLVATFGVIGYSVLYLRGLSTSSSVRFAAKPIVGDPVKLILAANILAILGVLILTASLSSGPHVGRADTWMYGRYIETMALPLIGTGLLVAWSRKVTLALSAIVLFTAGVFFLFVNSENTYLSNLNQVNIQSFWPLLITRNTEYLIWFSAGAMLIAGVGYIAEKRRYLIALVLPLVLGSAYLQYGWHKSILVNYSKTSGLHAFVLENYEKGSCVGMMDKGKDVSERLHIYLYYLHDYSLSRMTPQDWFENCDGPYLTFNSDSMKEIAGARPVGREVRSGLLVYDKVDNIAELEADSSTSDFYVNLRDQMCVLMGCYEWKASSSGEDLTNVGVYEDGSLNSTGVPGYLLYGPYTSMKAGAYNLLLDTNFEKADKNGEYLTVKVTANNGEKVLLSKNFTKMNTDSIRFKLNSNVENFEVQLIVGEGAQVGVSSYKIEIVNKGSDR